MSDIKTVCFTGHRPDKLGGYKANPLQSWVMIQLGDAISRSFISGFSSFICGGALGVDHWAAEEVIGLRDMAKVGQIHLTIACPFEGYDDKWPGDKKQEVRQLLTRADKVVYVCEPPYAAWKYQKRNEWMVNNSNAVIAVWDGSEGGTANTVNYALKVGKPIFRIDSKLMKADWLK